MIDRLGKWGIVILVSLLVILIDLLIIFTLWDKAEGIHDFYISCESFTMKNIYNFTLDRYQIGECLY